MSRLWVKVIRKHRITQQEAVPCSREGVELELIEVCKKLDIPSPIWLTKQRVELEQFGLTSFAASDFIEHVNFDRLEINWLADDGIKHRSNDPRNDFSDF